MMAEKKSRNDYIKIEKDLGFRWRNGEKEPGETFKDFKRRVRKAELYVVMIVQISGMTAMWMHTSLLG